MIFDFETRSRCDLKKHGAYRYATHPTTEILCLAYKIGGLEELWYPGDPDPEVMLAAVEAGELCVGHNVNFDYLIWEHCRPDSWPEMDPIQLRDTMALSLWHGGPAALDLAGRFWAGMRKDSRGADLVRKLSIPQSDGTFRQDREMLQEMGEYCLQDVRVTAGLLEALPPLSDEEYLLWYINECINERGIPFDRDLLEQLVGYANLEKADLNDEIRRLTGGAVEKATQVARIKAWCADQGYPIASLNKDQVRVEELPEAIQPVVQVRLDAARSSVAKFQAALDRMDTDDRVRGSLLFCGASGTGRWSSRGVQVHNLKRKVEHTETALLALNAGDRGCRLLYGAGPSEVLSRLVRRVIRARPGNVIVRMDYDQIEARVAAWIGHGWDKLDIFARGDDPYVQAYRDMFRHDGVVTPEQRYIGKVSELAFGYGGGVKAYKAFGGPGDKEASEEARDNWRAANSWAPHVWTALDFWAFQAVMQPGTLQVPRGEDHVPLDVVYYCDGNSLMLRLPSGRLIRYQDPQIEELMKPWGAVEPTLTYAKGSWSPAWGSDSWPRDSIYGGRTLQNICEGISRDIMAHHLLQLGGEAPVIMTVHDEIVLEVPLTAVDNTVEELNMLELPDWAEGLPVTWGIDYEERYGK